MSDRWSEQLARRYRIQLPPDLVDWFDNGWWEKKGGREFHRPLSPATLLDPPAGLIWAGMLPADMLPLVSNDYGDLICLRVGLQESVWEIVIWRHGGGDWIPTGKTLAEAMLYDALIGGPYSRQEQFHDREEVDPRERYTFAAWAVEHVAFDAASTPADWTDSNWSELLIAVGVARECFSRDECLRCLHTPLRERRAMETARKLELPWSPEFISWQFDAALAPRESIAELCQSLDIAPPQLAQDWQAAAAQAKALTANRQDLAWAWDILGWQAERSDDIAGAIAAYRQGCRASQFSDQSIDFRTHWFDEACGKFAAWRLRELRQHLPADVITDEYIQILIAAEGEKLPRRIGNYWLAAAAEATRAGEDRRAYDCFYNAGWDIGLETREGYREVLTGLIESAERAGDLARREIAKVHLASL